MYGWWLPNDIRGSMSTFVHSDVISELGTLHYGRKKIQPCRADLRAFFDEAKAKLKHPMLDLHPSQFEDVTQSFADVIRRERYTCYAWATMPDHVHAVLRKHRDQAEDMIAKFQEASRIYLRAIGLRPEDHPVWGGPGWKVFLDTPEDIGRTIEYVHNNPGKMRLPDQDWDFVVPYDNWPFHKRSKGRV
jgi:REP element-mobilizing transposase RayT